MFTVPSLSRVCRLAVADGLRFRLAVRRSRVSLSGVVAVLSFRSFSAAQVCAASWAMLLPAACGGVVMRRSGSAWAVSVPVQVWGGLGPCI
jgi:hypothetical protein